MQTKEYNVTTLFDENSYCIGNRFIFIDNVLIDTGRKTITPVPMGEDDVKRLKEKLDEAIEKNLTFRF